MEKSVKTVHIGSDHGGFSLKTQLIQRLEEAGYAVDDLGTFSEESVDYPEYAVKVAEKVLEDNSPGIIICGTGIGISIAANRIRGIRAALCHCVEYAEMARKHNNANVLALGGRFTDPAAAGKIAEVFLNTGFEGGRHERRIELIDKIN